MIRSKLITRVYLLTLLGAVCAGASLWWFASLQPVPRDWESPPPKQTVQAAPLPIEVSGDLAFTNLTVIDVDAGVARPGLTVVVKGDRITAVHPTVSCRVLETPRVVDGSGKFLIPGLWDMHVHLVHASLVPLFVQNGVTGVRHMFSFNPFYRPTAPAVPGDVVYPRIVTANQMLDGPTTPFTFPAKQNVVIVKDDTTARAGVRELQKRGNDFVKVYSKLPRDAYFATLDEAKTLGMSVCGHLPHAVSLAEACEKGQLTIEHLGGVAIGCSIDEARLMAELLAEAPGGTATDTATGWRVQVKAHESYNSAKAEMLFRKLKKNGTWHTPSLVVARATSTLGEVHVPDPAKSMPPLVAEFWKRDLKDNGVKLPMLGLSFTKADLAEWKGLDKKDQELVRQMHKAGIPILAGTDSPAPYVVPGHSLHDELALFTQAGMTPGEALRTATLNPARCLGREKDLGTIAPGKFADLVLLAQNPLADIHNTRSIEMVLIGGRIVPR